jgi:hypothetical protein
MRRSRGPFAAVAGLVALALAAGLVLAAGTEGQAPTGYISKDRIVELAKAADPAVATFTPAAAAVASLLALVDPVHIRMFICASRPADLKLAAAVGLVADAAANPAFTAEFVAVAEDLSEPSGLISENAVTKAPEIIVYWMNQEVARLHPEAGAAIDADLAEAIFQARTQICQDMMMDKEFFKFTFHKDLTALDCKRCHGPE